MENAKSGIFYYSFFGLILLFSGIVAARGNWLYARQYNPFRAHIVEVLEFRSGANGQEFKSVPQGSFRSCFLKVQLEASQQDILLGSRIRPCAQLLVRFYKPGDKIIVYTDRKSGQVENPAANFMFSLLLAFMGCFSLYRAYGIYHQSISS